MGDPWTLELRISSDSVELRRPLSAALYAVVIAAVGLGMLFPAVGVSSGLRAVWQGIVDLTIVGVAGHTVWLLWLSTVRFDFTRDQIRHGLVMIGRMSDVERIEPSADERAALQLVFRDERRQVRRWRIPGVRPRQAYELGTLLAEELRVPFAQPARPA